MSIRDPEGFEVRNLLLAIPFTGKQVLEIGCGSGWLTRQYAPAAGKVTGADPSLEDIQEGRIDQATKGTNILLTQCMGEKLPFPTDLFDIALFSNSL